MQLVNKNSELTRTMKNVRRCLRARSAAYGCVNRNTRAVAITAPSPMHSHALCARALQMEATVQQLQELKMCLEQELEAVYHERDELAQQLEQVRLE